ncbi:hypothetical protein [Metapseudomonas otitidis]|uniref:hypothetical protein n=1 Tax=Metapseudomonas otitidis TaxID=319939 RepID=UPI001F117AC2|nr:hypothetical protein [Pseudomonas otitidis]
MPSQPPAVQPSRARAVPAANPHLALRWPSSHAEAATDTERQLLEDADRRALAYLDGIPGRRVLPTPDAIAALAGFDGPLPEQGLRAQQALQLLDELGSPATTASNGGRYFGFVIGATLPAAAAAERLVLAWDQCASSFDNSPAADRIEKAPRWHRHRRQGARLRQRSADTHLLPL